MTALVVGRDPDILAACEAALSAGPDGGARAVRAVALADSAGAEGRAIAEWERLEGDGHPVDVLVTVPGSPTPAPIMRSDDDALRSQLERDLAWQHPVLRRAATRMAERRRGRLVLVSSVGALTGAALESPYGSALAGVLGLMRALARELGPRGVTVNAVLPGPMESLRDRADRSRRMTAHLDDIVRRTPTGRLCRPEDVADVIAFLASDEAAFVTGTLIPVDGGLSMGFG